MEKDKFFAKRKRLEMYKEVIISIVLIISIFGLNYVTQTNTDQTVSIMKQELENVKAELLTKSPDYEKALEKAKKTYDKWEELDDKMAFYVEHDQLEKVKTAITSMVSFIETQDDSQSVESIDRCMYILEYIDEREKVTWDNIF